MLWSLQMKTHVAEKIVRDAEKCWNLRRLRGSDWPYSRYTDTQIREAYDHLRRQYEANRHLPELRKRPIDPAVLAAIRLMKRDEGPDTHIIRCRDCGKPAVAGDDRCYSCSCD
jgi:hypothetical protein